ncbi:hypothetical protein [Streptomyces violascens]|uniref:Uncharacterized protein n=1 Tax=Streptomyces violascens TaxID=67381 RepID=A0ABQ3QXG7_9ACTN|nr:hypothetical protein [Streptomyces violascens]GGU13514.1 hypothetical protein GCM10010289_39030 [Streptomyces violascens]GHI41953.1 hypothetical protein Sviol_63610 [Streptomyces violascens]
MIPPRLRTPRQAARTVVRDPLGAVFLLRYDNEIWPPQLSDLLDGWSPGDRPADLGYVPVRGRSGIAGRG